MRASRVPFTQGVVAAWRNVRGGTRPEGTSVRSSIATSAARVGFHAKHAEEDFRVQAQTRAARKHVALRVPGDQRHVLSFYRSFTVSQPAGSRRRDERSADGLSPKDNIGQGMARGAEGSQDGDRRVKGPYSSGGNMSSHQKTNSHMLIRGGEQGTGGEQHAGGRGQHHSIGKDWEAEVVAKRIFRKLQSLRGNDKWGYFEEVFARGEVNVFHCNTMMISIRSLDEGQSLLKRMRLLGIAPDNWTYSAFVNKATARGHMDEAEAAVVQMQEAGIPPNVVVYSTLLDGYGKLDMVGKAMEVWQRMEAAKVAPNAHTFVAMIDLYSKMGDMTKAENFFARLMSGKDGVCPEVQAFTALISGYTRLGMLTEVEKVFDRFQTTDIKPTTAIYNSMLNAYDKIAELEDVLTCVKEMESLNIPKNIITFNCMMDAYGKRGLMNEARQIFDQMKEEGLKPDDVSFSTLIDGYGKTGRHNEAVSFLKEARAQASAKGEKRSLALTHASNALINSFCKYGNLDQAESLLAEMKSSDDPGERPTVETYCSLVMGYNLAGRSRAAVEVHKEVKETGIVTDRGYYMIYLTVVREANEWVAGRRAFQDAVDDLIEPFCSCLSVGKMYVKLDVHGMSPGAAAAAVEWVLRKAMQSTFSKHSLMIVTGKMQTYTYDFNVLREEVVKVLLDLGVNWKLSDGMKMDVDQEKGGRLIVLNGEWHKFRLLNRIKLQERAGKNSTTSSSLAALARMPRHDDGDDDDAPGGASSKKR